MKPICILLVVLLSDFFLAQEPVTFSNDRFSGISSVVISPTQSFLNENPWDINFVSEDVFLHNDYLYVSKQSILGLTSAKIESASPKKGISGETSANVLDFFNKNFSKFHFSSDIMGPSFSIAPKIKGQKYVFGVFTRLRTQASGIGIDDYLRFQNSGAEPPMVYKLNPFKVNVMNWGEFAFHFSKDFGSDSNHQWIFGANLKYEIGYDAAVVNNKQVSTLRRVQQEDETYHTKISDYDIDAFYATSYDFNKEKYTAKKQGSGFGLDFGIAYLEKDSDNYNFKASFNILDLGYIRFNGSQHHLNGATFEFERFENNKIKNPQHLFQLVSEEIYGNPNQSLVGNQLKIGLPTSLHLNASKKFLDNHFLNFDWIQRVSVFENSLKRSNITTVSYSIQKRFFGIGASTSLYEYEDLRLGGYIRLGPLILGSENAFPLLFKHPKLHGADFYIALKIYPFWDDELSRRQRSKCNCD